MAPERCVVGCGELNCTQCRCRNCETCRCTDPLGQLLVEPMCSHSWDNHFDIPLGLVRSYTACLHACNHHVSPSGAVCEQWTLDAPTSERSWPRQCYGHTGAPLVITGWEPPGIVRGVSTCAALPQVAGAFDKGSSPPTFGILMTVGSFACSPAVANRLARAYSEASRGGYFARLIHISRDDGKGSRALEDAKASKALSEALAPHILAAAVTRIGIDELRTVFPSLLQQMRRIQWHDRRRPLWLANGCDLPTLAYYALHADSLPHTVQHLWVVQHDVGWTGELPRVLAAIGSSAPLVDTDLICDDPYAADQGWLHFAERNYLRDDEVHACLLPVSRFSTRLLGRLVSLVAAGNATAYCEIRAPSACANSTWGCHMGSIRAASHLLGPFSYFTKFEENFLSAPIAAQFDEHSAGSHGCGTNRASIGRLYHQVTN